MADSTAAIVGALATAREEGILEAEDVDGGPIESTDGETTEVETEETSTEEDTPTTTEVEDDETISHTEKDEKVENIENVDDSGETKIKGDGDVDEFGLKPKVNGKENRIPYTKTRKIIDNQLAKGYGVVAKVLGIDPTTITHKTAETIIGDAIKDIPQLRERLKGFDDLEPIMRFDGDTFIKMLAESNPKQYKKFLAVLEEGYAPPTREAVKEEDDPEPELDYDLGEGKKTYSAEGWKKREAWVKRGMERTFQKTLDARLKPLDEERQTAKTQQEQTDAYNTRITTTLHHAKEWEGFVENEAEIKAALPEFAKLPLEFRVMAAYVKVAMSKLKTTRQKMRDEILAEQKKAVVKSTSTPETTKVVTKEEKRAPGEGSQSVIRAALNKARASGKL
jgi:hypothetical protein